MVPHIIKSSTFYIPFFFSLIRFLTILSNLKKQGKPESWTEKTRICFKNKISLFYNQNPPNRLIVINKVYLNNIDLPCPLRLYLYTGRKETKGIPVPNYIALSLVQYQDNFSVLIVTFFNLGLDIQITAIPNCRLQSFFFSFFCHAKFDRFGLVEENPKKSAI